ncbi:helix-turn-helix domain-containing protein, partial [Roseiarcus sp.]|uniref:helix-turn-helix domain-containing protein n=1 Tax=Roseiarcus sp. TaxID=1969460 RepID=UPI003F9DB945
GTRADAARLGGVGPQTLRDWVLRFNAKGPGGLVDGKSTGRPSLLDDAQRRALVAMVTAMKLEAFKYYHIPGKDIGLAGIVAKPTPELLKLQADLIAAASPFTVETGDSAAFVTTPDDPIIDPFLIGYVSTFVPKASGEQFNPHVTTGVALKSDLDQMLAEPFEEFSFSPAGAAVYQLGQFGTAPKKLKELHLKQ